MKRSTLLIVVLLIATSSLHSQDQDSLTSEQKKEYNRRKLTVEKVSESSGGMGWYWGFFAKKVDTWRAFKGLDSQIETEEFFRITGYVEEANKVKANLESANGKVTLGIVLYTGGLIASIIPKTETKDLGYGISYDEVSYPMLLPGTLAWIGGLYFWYEGTLMKLKPVAPYQSAADIAEEYNILLIEEIRR